jgi:hypothetical protein
MRTRPRCTTGKRRTGTLDIARIVVGLIWLAGAVFNALVTIRMEDPYGWIAEKSPFRVWRRFFGDVVGARPAFWTALLVIGEAGLGVLTLARGGWARLGLAGGAIFSALLFALATPYTLVMGPYAIFLAWLARKGDRSSLVDGLRSLIARRGQGTRSRRA